MPFFFVFSLVGIDCLGEAKHASSSTAGLLILGSTDMWGQIIYCYVGCACALKDTWQHLWPLPTACGQQPPPACDSQKCPDIAQCPLGVRSPQTESHCSVVLQMRNHSQRGMKISALVMTKLQWIMWPTSKARMGFFLVFSNTFTQVSSYQKNRTTL